MRAKDLMRSPALTIRRDATVADLCDLLQAHHVNGMPVVDETERLVGVVTEEDVLYGMMGIDPSTGKEEPQPASEGGPPAPTLLDGVRVEEIMTSPAISTGEETDLVEVCRIMWRMRIHRLPIVAEGKVTGILSAMDLVRAVAEGEIRP